jgi:hypothetical protein
LEITLAPSKLEVGILTILRDKKSLTAQEIKAYYKGNMPQIFEILRCMQDSKFILGKVDKENLRNKGLLSTDYSITAFGLKSLNDFHNVNNIK